MSQESTTAGQPGATSCSGWQQVPLHPLELGELFLSIAGEVSIAERALVKAIGERDMSALHAAAGQLRLVGWWADAAGVALTSDTLAVRGIRAVDWLGCEPEVADTLITLDRIVRERQAAAAAQRQAPLACVAAAGEGSEA